MSSFWWKHLEELLIDALYAPELSYCDIGKIRHAVTAASYTACKMAEEEAYEAGQCCDES